MSSDAVRSGDEPTGVARNVDARRRLRETSIEIEIPFRHVDLLGVVWHGHYYEYFEEARTQLMRGCGLDAGDLIGARYGLFVIESKCRHVAALTYGDRIRVDAWAHDIEHRINIRFEIANLSRDGQRAARGHTILATTDLERNLLLETPDEIQRRLRA
jgi:acyl-CoA thioester hydrolase